MPTADLDALIRVLPTWVVVGAWVGFDATTAAVALGLVAMVAACYAPTYDGLVCASTAPRSVAARMGATTGAIAESTQPTAQRRVRSTEQHRLGFNLAFMCPSCSGKRTQPLPRIYADPRNRNG